MQRLGLATSQYHWVKLHTEPHSARKHEQQEQRAVPSAGRGSRSPPLEPRAPLFEEVVDRLVVVVM